MTKLPLACRSGLVATALFALLSASAHSAATSEASPTRWVVTLKQANKANAADASTSVAERLARTTQRSGATAARLRQTSDRHFVLTAADAAPGGNLQDTVAALRQDPMVLAVEPDQRRKRHNLVPNDPLYSNATFTSTQPVGQWHLKGNTGDVKSAINADAAWSYTQGSASVVVAVLDTGVRFDHPDLRRLSAGGRLLDGYDFVSEDGPNQFIAANDGNGWDADPSDPGDWIDAALIAANTSALSDCSEEDSSWHGTRTAGIIGAMSQNGTGISGIDWNARILTVRVLGRCGGFTSDIVSGMRWAAGLHVIGVPDNFHPAKVINMSLGGSGACSIMEQTAVDEILARGTVIVASAGNSGQSVESPGNCRGVIAVGGVRHTGTKVGYSSMGPEVTVTAPAGNCVNIGFGEPCLYSIDTTTDSGAKDPAGGTYTDQINSNVGTSFSAPMVAAVAGLMVGINPTLTPAQVKAALQSSSRPFPVDPTLAACPGSVTSGDTVGQCNCTTTQCGAGMLDALAAVKAVNPTECLFNWAENGLPDVLPAGPQTHVNGPYQFRFYPSQSSYLGVSADQGRLLYIAPNGVLSDLGAREGWYTQSGCYRLP